MMLILAAALNAISPLVAVKVRDVLILLCVETHGNYGCFGLVSAEYRN